MLDDPFWPTVRLARLHRHFGDHQAAECCYATATDLPGAQAYGWVWISRGANLARLNRLDEALACHRRALTLPNADHDEAHLNIGLVNRARGSYAEAIEAFGSALRLTPDYPEALAGMRSIDGIAEAVRLADITPGIRG